MAHWALLRCYNWGVSTVKLCTLICAYGTWTPLPVAPHISERKQKDRSNQLHVNIFFLAERYSLCKEIYKSFISQAHLAEKNTPSATHGHYGGSAENIILRCFLGIKAALLKMNSHRYTNNFGGSCEPKMASTGQRSSSFCEHMRFNITLAFFMYDLHGLEHILLHLDLIHNNFAGPQVCLSDMLDCC